MHARNARQLKLAAKHGKRRCQWSHSGTRIAQKKFRCVAGQMAAQAINGHAVAALFNRTAQLPKGRQHHSSVIGGQQVVDSGFAVAQGGQQQYAVGNAFGARQANLSAGTCQCRYIQVGDIKHAKNYLCGFCELMRQLARVPLACSIRRSRRSPSLLAIRVSSV